MSWCIPQNPHHNRSGIGATLSASHTDLSQRSYSIMEMGAGGGLPSPAHTHDSFTSWSKYWLKVTAHTHTHHTHTTHTPSDHRIVASKWVLGTRLNPLPHPPPGGPIFFSQFHIVLGKMAKMIRWHPPLGLVHPLPRLWNPGSATVSYFPSACHLNDRGIFKRWIYVATEPYIYCSQSARGSRNGQQRTAKYPLWNS